MKALHAIVVADEARPGERVGELRKGVGLLGAHAQRLLDEHRTPGAQHRGREVGRSIVGSSDDGGVVGLRRHFTEVAVVGSAGRL